MPHTGQETLRILASILLTLMVAAQPAAMALGTLQPQAYTSTGAGNATDGGKPGSQPQGRVGSSGASNPERPTPLGAEHASNTPRRPSLYGEISKSYSEVRIRNPDTLNASVPADELGEFKIMPLVSLTPGFIEPGWNGLRSGNGSESNPYLISGWYIDKDLYRGNWEPEYAVYISDIPGYVVLENLTIKGSMYIWNVGHVILRNVTFLETGTSWFERRGHIYIANSNITIINSTVGDIYESWLASEGQREITLEGTAASSLDVYTSNVRLINSTVEDLSMNWWFPCASKLNLTITVEDRSTISDHLIAVAGGGCNVTLTISDSAILAGTVDLRSLRKVLMYNSTFHTYYLHATNISSFEIIDSYIEILSLEAEGVSNLTISGVSGAYEGYAIFTLSAASSHVTILDSMLTRPYSTLFSLEENATVTVGNVSVKQAWTLLSVSSSENAHMSASLYNVEVESANGLVSIYGGKYANTSVDVTLRGVTAESLSGSILRVDDRYGTLEANITLENVTATAYSLATLDSTWPQVIIRFVNSTLSCNRGPLYFESTDLFSLYFYNSTFNDMPAATYTGLSSATLNGTYYYLGLEDSSNVTVNATFLLARLARVESASMALRTDYSMVSIEYSSNVTLMLDEDAGLLLWVTGSSNVEINSQAPPGSLPEIYSESLVTDSSNVSIANISGELSLQRVSGFALHDTTLYGNDYLYIISEWSDSINVANLSVRGYASFDLLALSSSGVSLSHINASESNVFYLILINTGNVYISDATVRASKFFLELGGITNLTLEDVALDLSQAYTKRAILYNYRHIYVDNFTINGMQVGYFENANLSDADLAGLSGVIAVNSTIHLSDPSLPLLLLSTLYSNITITSNGSSYDNLLLLGLTHSILQAANLTAPSILVAWESRVEAASSALLDGRWYLANSTLVLEGSQVNWTTLSIRGHSQIESANSLFYASKIYAWGHNASISLNLTNSTVDTGTSYYSPRILLRADNFDEINIVMHNTIVTSALSSIIDANYDADHLPAKVNIDVDSSSIGARIEISWGNGNPVEGTVRISNSTLTDNVDIEVGGEMNVTITSSNLTGSMYVYIDGASQVALTNNTINRVRVSLHDVADARLEYNVFNLSVVSVRLPEPWDLSPEAPENASASLVFRGNTALLPVALGGGSLDADLITPEINFLEVHTLIGSWWYGYNVIPNYTVVIEDNTFQGGSTGVLVTGSTTYTGRERQVPMRPLVRITDNTFSNTTSYALVLDELSGLVRVESNRFEYSADGVLILKSEPVILAYNNFTEVEGYYIVEKRRPVNLLPSSLELSYGNLFDGVEAIIINTSNVDVDASQAPYVAVSGASNVTVAGLNASKVIPALVIDNSSNVTILDSNIRPLNALDLPSSYSDLEGQFNVLVWIANTNSSSLTGLAINASALMPDIENCQPAYIMVLNSREIGVQNLSIQGLEEDYTEPPIILGSIASSLAVEASNLPVGGLLSAYGSLTLAGTSASNVILSFSNLTITSSQVGSVVDLLDRSYRCRYYYGFLRPRGFYDINLTVYINDSTVGYLHFSGNAEVIRYSLIEASNSALGKLEIRHADNVSLTSVEAGQEGPVLVERATWLAVSGSSIQNLNATLVYQLITSNVAVDDELAVVSVPHAALLNTSTGSFDYKPGRLLDYAGLFVANSTSGGLPIALISNASDATLEGTYSIVFVYNSSNIAVNASISDTTYIILSWNATLTLEALGDSSAAVIQGSKASLVGSSLDRVRALEAFGLDILNSDVTESAVALLLPGYQLRVVNANLSGAGALLIADYVELQGVYTSQDGRAWLGLEPSSGPGVGTVVLRAADMQARISIDDYGSVAIVNSRIALNNTLPLALLDIDDAGRVLIVNSTITVTAYEAVSLDNVNQVMVYRSTLTSLGRYGKALELYYVNNALVNCSTLAAPGENGYSLYAYHSNVTAYLNVMNSTLGAHHVGGSGYYSSPTVFEYSYNGSVGVSRLGNYWSSYNGTDADGDGIGDAPQPIEPGNFSDEYPLIAPPSEYILREPFEVEPSESVARIIEGETAVHIFNITNLGVDTHTYTITSSDGVLNATSVTLGPGETAWFQLEYTPPSNGTFNVTVAVFQDGVKAFNATATAVTVAIPRIASLRLVSVDPSPYQEVWAGQTAVFNVTVENNGTIDVDVDAYAGNASVMPGQASIPVNATQTFTVTLTPPEPGVYNITLTLTPQQDPNATLAVSLTVNATPIPADFDVEPKTSNITVIVGETAVHVFSITNTGNVSDTYNITATAGTLNTTSVTLEPGETAWFQLSFSSNATGVYMSNITVRSTVRPDLEEVVQAVTVVREPVRNLTVIDVEPGTSLTIPWDGTAVFNVTLLNSGEVYENVTAQASLGTVEPQQAILAPGETATFTLTFTPGEPGNYTINLTFTTADSEVSTGIQLTVEVTPPARGVEIVGVYPSENQTVIIGETATFNVSIQNTGEVPENLTITASMGSVGPSQLTLQPGQTANVTVAFTPEEPGNYTILLTATSSDGEVSASINLSVNARLPRHELAILDIEPAPNQTIPWDGVAVFNVTVANLGEVAENVTATVSLGEVAPGWAVVEPGCNTTFTITFDPEEPGNYTILAYFTAASGEAQVNATLNVTVTPPVRGIEIVDVEPAANQTVIIGQEAVFNVTIQNTGEIPENVTIAVSRGQASPEEVTLEPGEAAVITVAFTPPSPGVYMIAFTASSADGQVTASINLTVNARLPVRAIEVTGVEPSLNQSIPWNGTALFNITLTNTGEVEENVTAYTTLGSISPAWAALAPGESATFTLAVSGLAPGDHTVNVFFDAGGGVNASLTLTVHVTPPYRNVSILAIYPSQTQQVFEGDEASYTITIANLGEVPENLTITASMGSVEPAQLTLQPGQTANITVTLSPLEPGEYTISVTVESEDGAVSVNASLSLVVEKLYAVILVSPGYQEATVPWYASATLEFNVTNLGNKTDTITVTASEGTVTPSQLVLKPGETATVTLEISGEPGVHMVTLTFSSSIDPNYTVTATANVTIMPPVYNFTITVTKAVPVASPTYPATITIVVENTGNAPDSYTITSPLAVENVTIELQPGESRGVTLELQPSSTGVYHTTVYVTSTGSARSETANVTVYSYRAVYHASSYGGVITLTAPEANITLTVTLAGSAEAWILVLPEEMQPPEPGAVVVYPMVDVRVEPASNATWPAVITIEYSDGLLSQLGVAEESLTPLYYDEQTGAWVAFSNYTIDTQSNKVIVYPSMGELSGSVVALTAEPAGTTTTTSQPPESTHTTTTGAGETGTTETPTESSPETTPPGGGGLSPVVMAVILIITLLGVLFLLRKR